MRASLSPEGWISAALLALALFTRAVPASANGRYPAAGLIAVDPSDPAHLLVRATYGLLSTRDRGGEWRWTCEPAIGYGGYEDPMITILADGTILAGLFEGLSAGKAGGCDWELAGGDLAGRYVTDLSAGRRDPSRAVLIVSNGVGPGQFLTQLWQTDDNAVSWTQAGVDLPTEFLAFNVDVALSDPSRVYVSGRYGAPEYAGVIERSLDRGQTWERLDIPGTDDQHLPFLSAIDPADPDVIYVRIDGDPSDALVVSADGGQTWTTAFESTGNLLGFALSPDGATVLLGGDKDGLWRAPASTLVFEKISDVGVRCLTWTPDALFACADEFSDGFTAGVSSDQGQTFTPILHLDALCGPLECDPQSDVALVCADLWGATKLTIGAKECEADADAGPVSSEGSSDGCGCRAGSAADVPPWVVLAAPAAAAAAAVAHRRRRARVAPRPTPHRSPS